MFIEDLLRALAAAEVRYCVVGGVAVNLHGIPRMTYDVDVVVPTTHEDLAAVDAVLTGLGLRPRLPLALVALADDALREEYRAERNLIAFTYTDPADPLREVDILVSPGIATLGLVERAITLHLGPTPVKIVSLPDLIALKRLAGRAQDLADIAHLERLAQELP